MQRSRFVFVQTMVPVTTGDQPAERMLWLLVSSNNRRLGQDVARRETYAESRAAVTRLQDGHARLTSQTATDQRDGRWIWHLSLDGVHVATSSRSYLRLRECDYNLQRFRDALAAADVVPGARRVTAGRSQRDSGPPAATRPIAGLRRSVS